MTHIIAIVVLGFILPASALAMAGGHGKTSVKHFPSTGIIHGCISHNGTLKIASGSGGCNGMRRLSIGMCRDYVVSRVPLLPKNPSRGLS